MVEKTVKRKQDNLISELNEKINNMKLKRDDLIFYESMMEELYENKDYEMVIGKVDYNQITNKNIAERMEFLLSKL
jgi:hypothetical protein